MLLKKLLYSFVILFFPFGLIGQYLSDEWQAQAFESAQSGVVVLKNQQDLLPLKRLDTLRIAYLSFGLDGYSTLLKEDNFHATLNLYIPTHKLELPSFSSKAEAKFWLDQLDDQYNLFIVGIHDFFAMDSLAANPIISYGLEYLVRQKNTVINLFGLGKTLEIIPSLEQADGLLLARAFQPYTRSVSAQIIFGGLPATNQLSIPLSSYFPKGSGIHIEKASRLGYAPAGFVNMDANYLRDSIQAIIEEGLNAKAYPGAQVLVAKDGKIIYHKTFGYHTYNHKRRVMKTDIYDFASITKVTSALPALMKLYGEGQFKLDAPLKQYWPSFENTNKGELTFRSMLAHNARLKPWIPYWRTTVKKNGAFKRKTFKPSYSKRYPVKITDSLFLHRQYKKRIYKAIGESPLNEKAGYVYSGLLFYLLPEMVSELTQSDFETYIKQNFYHRIGAFTITYNPFLHFPLERIIPTERDTFFRQVQIHGTVHDEGAIMMGGVSANAGLFGSANDLAKLMRLYMQRGTYGEERLIAEKAVNEFIKCQYCADGNRRGLGFDKPLIEYDYARSSVAKDASSSSFGHSGYTGTFAWADPEYDLLYIFYSNRVYPTRENGLLYDLSIRPRIHQVLYDAILDKSNPSSSSK